MSTSQSEYRKMVQELLDQEDGLSDWEINFLDSLSQWTGQFTCKQSATLQKIWNERIG